jgi:penicillin amidase
LPSSWADGRRGWGGWLSPDEYPRVIDPETGRLWSANARTVDGAMLAKMGHGAYVNGARAAQIRDGLFAGDRFSERDLLAIQLDDRAFFLSPWRDLLLGLLNDAAVWDDPRRGELRAFVEGRSRRAAVDSVGYRIVREFRAAVEERAFPALTRRCVEADPGFDYGDSGLQQEGPLWLLVTERPVHLLDPRFASWNALLLDAVDEVLGDALAGGDALADFTWGAHNTADIRHPMSRFVPLLSAWLDMPAVPLPGDAHMPLAQTHAYGVSQRMIVSPGREEQGVFHMPTGPSAHPLSPFFGRGHEAWVNGEPTAFLPGPPQHVLYFEPAS